MISGAVRPAILVLALLGSACSNESLAVGDEASPAGAPGAAAGASAAGKSATGTGGTSSPPGAQPAGGASGSANVAGMSSTGGQATELPRGRQKLEPEDGKTLLLVGQDT